MVKEGKCIRLSIVPSFPQTRFIRYPKVMNIMSSYLFLDSLSLCYPNITEITVIKRHFINIYEYLLYFYVFMFYIFLLSYCVVSTDDIYKHQK